MKPATSIPVALFVYNRDEILKRTLDCLKNNGVELLYVFSDGPKDNDEDARKVQQVRELIKNVHWAKVNLVEQDKNIGLDNSIRKGVSHIFQEHDKVIVVEDDVQVAPGFYSYMSSCLNHFEGNKSVAGVTALRYPFPQKDFKGYPYDVFFAPRFSSWGWGTWREVWQKIDFDTNNLKRRLKSVKPDVISAGADMKGMVGELKSGTLHGGWDIYCALNVLLNKQYFVWPRKNMIENGGFTDGTHAGAEPPPWSLSWEADRKFYKNLRLPEGLIMDEKVLEGFRSFFEQIVHAPAHSSNSKKILRKGKGALRKVKVLRMTVRTLRKVRSKLNNEDRQVPKPDPKDYSTLTTPMEIPVQREAYYLALNEYVSEGDKVLDVGMGLGYGLTIMSIKAKEVAGVDVDKKSVDYCNDFLFGRNPKLKKVLHYDGYHLPFKDNEYDVIVSIDVLEHVERYDDFLKELARVAKKSVVINTPNRRAENTNPDGTPKNYWHLREWSPDELKAILKKNGFAFEFYYINGPPDGPYKVSLSANSTTQSLTPVILLEGKKRK